MERKYTLVTSQNTGIKIICGINLFAALLHLLFWGFALGHLVPTLNTSNQAALATTLGIGVADLLWAVPLLLLGSIQLYRQKAIGWLSAQMAHILYFYSMTFVIVRDILSGQLSPGTFVFLPFTLFAVWATYYLWKQKSEFF